MKKKLDTFTRLNHKKKMEIKKLFQKIDELLENMDFNINNYKTAINEFNNKYIQKENQSYIEKQIKTAYSKLSEDYKNTVYWITMDAYNNIDHSIIDKYNIELEQLLHDEGEYKKIISLCEEYINFTKEIINSLIKYYEKKFLKYITKLNATKITLRR